MGIANYLITIISLGFQIYSWLIVARIILSYVRLRAHHPVIRFIYEITEPFLAIFRRILPPTSTGIDFSPIIAFFCLEVARQLVIMLAIRLFTGVL